MPRARQILKRAKAIKSIRQVTGTMEMVATARFRKSFQRVAATRPFVDGLAEVVSQLTGRGVLDGTDHPLLKPRGGDKRTLLLVITSNRGLCGAYNSSVQRAAEHRIAEFEKANDQYVLDVVGKRGLQHFRFSKKKVTTGFTQFDTIPKYEQVREIADRYMAEYLDGKISGVEVAYTQFISSGRQQVVVAPLLPLSDLKPAGAQAEPESRNMAWYELIPSGQEILGALLPLTVRMRMFQFFLNAAVSEQVIRIAAMRAATDSADDMIHSLTVLYNRTRQSQITTELAEIMGGRMGLEG